MSAHPDILQAFDPGRSVPILAVSQWEPPSLAWSSGHAGEHAVDSGPSKQVENSRDCKSAGLAVWANFNEAKRDQDTM